ncbi:MAG: hypothetical protein AAB893_00415, partial [Patescibacteria group bacterium]
GVVCSTTITRKDFLKIAAILGIFELLLTACSSGALEQKNISLTPVPLSPEILATLTPAQKISLQYAAMTYVAFSRIPGNVFAGAEVFASTSPRQTQII